MTPNLYVAIATGCQPWRWPSAFKSSSEDYTLYYSKQPVPGLYGKHRKGKRYLVAIKGNSKKDKEEIFRPKKNKQHTGEQANATEKEPAPSTKNETSRITVTQGVSFSRSGSSNSASTRLATVVGNELRSKSPYSKSSRSSTRSSTKTTILTATAEPVRRPSVILNVSHCSTSLNRPTPNTRKSSGFFWTMLNKTNGKSHDRTEGQGVAQIDMSGYRVLRKPLRIKYCAILERWLFDSELKERTTKTSMCYYPNCIETNPEECGRTINRKLFCLDDGFSWVIVPRRYPRSVKKADTHMYCVDQETGHMRRQTFQEMARHMILLEDARLAGPRILEAVEGESEADYMPVMRYLQKDREGEERGRSGARIRRDEVKLEGFYDFA